MSHCRICERDVDHLSETMGVCSHCLCEGDPAALERVNELRVRERTSFRLPTAPPSGGNVTCRLCVNRCRMTKGERGFCGLRVNRDGRLAQLGGTRTRGHLSWYADPLPTNCVASWTCPADGVGYPHFAHRAGPERGYTNLAVFYQSCTLDCLYCQNWHFRAHVVESARARRADELAAAVDESTACICFFGGDPSSQSGHAIAAARLALAQHPRRILRICWETNGTMNPRVLRKAVELSFESGGIVKFDLKCWSETLHIALTGVSNKGILDNFAAAARSFDCRPAVPLVIASTLLVPGYVDTEQVRHIAEFIAALNPRIPYSLLAFHPDFVLRDLPTTRRVDAENALEAAHAAGLENVHLGNRHLLT